MKALIFCLFLVFTAPIVWGQQDTSAVREKQLVKIVQTNKTELFGYILKEDEREIQFETQDGRNIFIPQYVIKEIVPIKAGDFNIQGDYVGEDIFATRYFITTNGLPLKKGEHYIQWNLFGPDFQFAVTERFGVGVMTSWLAVPIIGTAKFSFNINERSQFAVGTLIATSSWASLGGSDFGGALPFATISHGDRKANIALSAGYGAVWAEGNVDGRALTSIAGMTKVAPKISLVFDSFIVLRKRQGDPGLGLFIPGIRWHQAEGKAFQFGFAGVLTEGQLFPLAIPMLQWYRRL